MREELLAAFAVYCTTPFGRFHSRNPSIVRLAADLDRSPSAVAMKLCNLASLDPSQRARGIAGLGNASRGDRELWAEFVSAPEVIAYESQQALERLHRSDRGGDSSLAAQTPPTETEATAEVRVRLVQRFFRATVIASYDLGCAVCQLQITDLLNASHIIPWRIDVARRADPTNGIALCVLHDRAFDRGLITLDDELRVVVSPLLVSQSPSPLLAVGFTEIQGNRIHVPTRFAPDPLALEYHRLNVFRAA